MSEDPGVACQIFDMLLNLFKNKMPWFTFYTCRYVIK